MTDDLPELVLTAAGTTTVSRGGVATLGSGPASDLRVGAGPPEWVRFRYAGGWFGVVDDAASSVTLDGRSLPRLPAETRRPIGPFSATHALTLRHGADEVHVTVEVRTAASEQAQPTLSGGPAVPRLGRRVVIGRTGSGSEIEVSGADVEMRHASVDWDGRTAVVRDLRGGTGTYVDGRPILRAALRPGETFVVGHHVFRVGDDGALHQRTIGGPTSLVVRGLTVRYRGQEVPTVAGIDVDLTDGGMVAIVGPSGAGKSTLFAGLLGDAEVVSGAASLDDVALGTGTPPSPALVSLVPQQDATIPELTVRETLRYTAAVRLARDVGRAGLNATVEDVIRRLGLDAVGDLPSARLSGGQRRRLNVGMELLTNPALLMLDEPTSGLDEGLDRRMMEDLAELAAGSCVVLVVTHSTAHLDLVDAVLAVAAHDGGSGVDGGGRRPSETGYFGPPAGLRAAFDTDSYATVMDRLRHGGTAHRPLPVATPARTRSGRPPRAPVRRPALAVHLRREFRRMSLRPGLIAGLTVVGPAVTAGVAMMAAPAGFGGSAADPNLDLNTGVAVLALCLSFLAIALSLTSIVGDREVVIREHRWGVPASTVVLARVLSRLPFAVLQAAVAVGVAAVWRPGPESTLDLLPGWGGILAATGALTVTAMCLGALLSAVAPNTEKAVSLMSMSLGVMVVLSGMVVPLGDVALLTELAYLTPTRWGVVAIAAHVDLLAAGTPGVVDELWTHDTAHFATAIAALSAMSVAFVATAIVLLPRTCRSGR